MIAAVDDAFRNVDVLLTARLRTHYRSQNVTVAAMQIAEKNV